MIDDLLSVGHHQKTAHSGDVLQPTSYKVFCKAYLSNIVTFERKHCNFFIFLKLFSNAAVTLYK